MNIKCRNVSHCDWPVTHGDIVALLLLKTSDMILVLTDDLHFLYLFELKTFLLQQTYNKSCDVSFGYKKPMILSASKDKFIGQLVNGIVL